ncbi:type I-E CRISPR-associated protein Cse1/CasA [Vibrio campbellii]|uniref:type I-E CRISPR-associated protein Cse1/CasA n=1 Tax=Vibrio campbellii TaxID=680 RepID=UPI000CD34205|nr:type I-E CRISPR-associated protein Cse1/CasA [Vibrio campbellii]AUW07380.1 type I-E CRISPR-associated protein Cse1/CasA [Vibrio campbellii]
MNHFNLIEESWIPVAGVGLVSLRDVFNDHTLKSLGGTPIEKIALTKLLVAIAQSAYTPEDFCEWSSLGSSGLSSKCLSYLEYNKNRFYLYGDNPFLQFHEVKDIARYSTKGKKEKLLPYGALIPEVATGNTTRLTGYNIERSLTDGQKALILITQLSMCFSGKKADNSIVLTEGYEGKSNDKGKPSTPRSGTGIAHMGLLHSFAHGSSLQETIWLNVFTNQDIQETNMFQLGVGVAPWEQMPKGEDCAVARRLKSTLMGRLVPMCRFMYLEKNGVYITEGIHHLTHKDHMFDPSITVKPTCKTRSELKVVWTDPDRKPWRQLPSMLGFLSGSPDMCYQLKFAFDKAKRANRLISVWSGGAQVSANAGEQYLSGGNDTVETIMSIPYESHNHMGFIKYTNEIKELDAISKRLYGCVLGYASEFNKDGKDIALNATMMFWEACGHNAQLLIDSCFDETSESYEKIYQLRKVFFDNVQTIYDILCANHSSRQMQAWSKCRPNAWKYLERSYDEI